MPAVVYMVSSMDKHLVVETPAVAEEKVLAARENDDLFVTLTSFGKYVDFKEVGRQQNMIFIEGEPKDSYEDIKIRHDGILAIRGAHPQEVPD